MSKRLQLFLNADAEMKLNKVFEDITTGFTSGNIKISDLVSEMILNSDLDIKEVRLKYTDLKKSLLELAHAENIDVDAAIKALLELKNKNTKKVTKSSPKSQENFV
jgi:hypothetical protein